MQAIVEEAQATPEQLAIRELNVGVYCFSAEWLWEALHRIPLSPKGEYYLTDLVAIANSDGFRYRLRCWKMTAKGLGSTPGTTWLKPKRSCASASTSTGCWKA